MNARIQERTAHVVTLDADEPGPAYVQSVTTLNRHLGTLPAFGGNSVELLPDYAESIAAMIGEINEAETFVHVQFYITAWDDLTGPFFDALVGHRARCRRCGCCSTISAHGGFRATRACWNVWPGPRSTGVPCSRSIP